MIPIHSGSFIVGAAFALALWSYVPLYILPITIGGHLLKMEIEVRNLRRRPRRSRELIDKRSRKERFWRTRTSVMNTSHTNSGSRIRLSHISGESRLGMTDTSRFELKVSVYHITIRTRL